MSNEIFLFDHERHKKRREELQKAYSDLQKAFKNYKDKAKIFAEEEAEMIRRLQADLIDTENRGEIPICKELEICINRIKEDEYE